MLMICFVILPNNNPPPSHATKTVSPGTLRSRETSDWPQNRCVGGNKYPSRTFGDFEISGLNITQYDFWENSCAKKNEKKIKIEKNRKLVKNRKKS